MIMSPFLTLGNWDHLHLTIRRPRIEGEYSCILSFFCRKCLIIIMCGIHVIISNATSGGPPPLSQSLRQSLLSRGPDHFGQVRRSISVDGIINALDIVLTSTVLALRGDHVAAQPLEDAESGSVLCWNGEAWRLDGEAISGNDGEAIFARLRVAKSTSANARETCILNVLRSIEGPFAFVYYDAESKRLYFGRDRLGRRSLLRCESEDRRLITFSSVADAPVPGWKEVDADGLYSIRLDALATAVDTWDINTCIVKHDWIPSASVDMVSAAHPGPSMFVLAHMAGLLEAYFPRSQVLALSTQQYQTLTTCLIMILHLSVSCDTGF